MWPSSFEERLLQWHDLRQVAVSDPLEKSLICVNDWWLQSPWRPYYLHWDDHKNWPDPWSLLADNVYCDLARCLGIVYTMMMINNANLEEICIADTDDGNLVLVDNGKYILNWAPGQLLNIASAKITINRTLSGQQVIHLLG